MGFVDMLKSHNLFPQGKWQPELSTPLSDLQVVIETKQFLFISYVKLRFSLISSFYFHQIF